MLLQFFKTSVLLGHSDVVQNACGMYFGQNSAKYLWVATLSTDSSLKVWKRFGDQTGNILHFYSKKPNYYYFLNFRKSFILLIILKYFNCVVDYA